MSSLTMKARCLDKRGSFFKVNGIFIQNIKHTVLYETSAAECAIQSVICSKPFLLNRKHFIEHLFLKVVFVVRLRPSYFMCMLFSCTLNRVFGIKQLVAFFAANAENISFIMHRHKIIKLS